MADFISTDKIQWASWLVEEFVFLYVRYTFKKKNDF